MKTLTIADARKSLGRWLKEAANGADIGIVVGEDIVALRKVEAAALNDSQRPYGATPEELKRFDHAVERNLRAERRAGTLMKFKSVAELKEAVRHPPCHSR